MPENKGKFKYLVGSKNVSNKALEPYNKDVCDFLDDFSAKNIFYL